MRDQNLLHEIQPEDGNEPLLSLRGISKYFGGLKAVDNVSLTIENGELRCLIGPNGAGKSTIFRLITGYYRQDSGDVIYKAKEISRLQPFQRARLGLSIKFQTPMVYQDLTVRHNMWIPMQRIYKREAIATEIDKYLKLLGLLEVGEQFVKNISHGQRQWLEIGMALSVKPDLLLLDEPTAGMSLEETQKTAQIVKDLNRDGMAIIVIDHDMEFVRTLNSKITVLHLGKWFAEGNLAEIESNEEVRSIYLGKK